MLAVFLFFAGRVEASSVPSGYTRLAAGTVKNTIIWGDRGGAELVQEAAVTADHNLTDRAPLFIGTGTHPYRLRFASPAVDAGAMRHGTRVLRRRSTCVDNRAIPVGTSTSAATNIRAVVS